jgi:acetyltransferase-like isoleucine patch superfamily enzyme
VTLYGSAWLDASGAEGFVELGDDVSIDRMSVLYGQGGLSIGARCAIASGVVIYSQSNQDLKKDGTPVSLQPVRYAAVTIGDGCWLGAGAIVLPGVTVGRGASIGAGAVVRNEVPANALAVGVPAIAKAKAPAVSGVGS